MSYVPEVTARWKRRATEIADAIGGGESSSTVSGTVSLSAASITALADAIDDRLRLSAIAVSIADVLSVKTNANDSVAVTGTVSATLPANLVIPVDTVAGTNNGANGSGVAVTVPVNPAHNVTVPVKANSANQPMSSAGIPVTVPVNPTHSVTVPVKSNVSGQPLTLGNVVAQIGVAVGSSTVPVSVVTNTSQGASVFGTGVVVPVAGGTANIQVANTAGLTVEVSNNNGLVCDIANTNNLVVAVDTVAGTNNAANGSGVAVVVPVTASGTVLDVKITEVAPLAKTSFHEAMETALEEADGIVVEQSTAPVGVFFGTVDNYSSTHMRVKATNGTTYNANSINISGSSESVTRNGNTVYECERLIGLRVFTYSTDYQTVVRNWKTVDAFPGGLISGAVTTVAHNLSSSELGHIYHLSGGYWWIKTDEGAIVQGQRIAGPGGSYLAATTANHNVYQYRRVQLPGVNGTMWDPHGWDY